MVSGRECERLFYIYIGILADLERVPRRAGVYMKPVYKEDVRTWPSRCTQYRSVYL